MEGICLKSEIDISRENVDGRAFSLMTNAIRENRPMFYQGGRGAASKHCALSLERSKIDLSKCKQLAGALKTNSSITDLNLRSNRIGPEGVEILGKALAKNKILVSLDISNNHIGPKGAERFFKQLSPESKLESLNLSQNTLRDDGAESVCRHLPRLFNLRSISLERNGIGVEGGEIFAKCPRLLCMRSINAAHNYIGAPALAVLVRNLIPSTAIQSLRISYNESKIDCDGAQDLALELQKFIRSNLSATSLDISGNRCLSNQVGVVLAPLQGGGRITSLVLSGLSLGDAGVSQVASILEHNFCVKSLSLAKNECGDAGAAAILRMCIARASSGCSLEYLDLSNNEITLKINDVVLPAVKSVQERQFQRILQTVHLFGNPQLDQTSMTILSRALMEDVKSGMDDLSFETKNPYDSKGSNFAMPKLSIGDETRVDCSPRLEDPCSFMNFSPNGSGKLLSSAPEGEILKRASTSGRATTNRGMKGRGNRGFNPESKQALQKLLRSLVDQKSCPRIRHLSLIKGVKLPKDQKEHLHIVRKLFAKPTPGKIKQKPDPATSQKYLKAKESFYKRLLKFHSTHKIKMQKNPLLGGRPVDLYHLYLEVTSRGGYEHVVGGDGSWARIFNSLENSVTKMTDASYRLKRIYRRFLLPYEHSNFFGLPSTSPSKNSNSLVTFVINPHVVAKLSQARKSSQSSMVSSSYEILRRVRRPKRQRWSSMQRHCDKTGCRTCSLLRLRTSSSSCNSIQATPASRTCTQQQATNTPWKPSAFKTTIMPPRVPVPPPIITSTIAKRAPRNIQIQAPKTTPAEAYRSPARASTYLKHSPLPRNSVENLGGLPNQGDLRGPARNKYWLTDVPMEKWGPEQVEEWVTDVAPEFRKYSCHYRIDGKILASVIQNPKLLERAVPHSCPTDHLISEIKRVLDSQRRRNRPKDPHLDDHISESPPVEVPISLITEEKVTTPEVVSTLFPGLPTNYIPTSPSLQMARSIMKVESPTAAISEEINQTKDIENPEEGNQKGKDTAFPPPPPLFGDCGMIDTFL